jgi:putative transposase
LNDLESLKHTRWECKYHIVFIPKYRKKALYGALRQRMGGLLRELAGQRESRIEQGHLMLDHVHMLISIPPKYSVAQVVGYMKGKSAIYIARTFMGKPRNFTGESFWARGYFVSTVGRDEKVHSRVHQEPRAGRPEDRPTQHVQQVATSSGSKPKPL